eukprot:1092361-Prymnesium_polylepis.1
MASPTARPSSPCTIPADAADGAEVMASLLNTQRWPLFLRLHATDDGRSIRGALDEFNIGAD